MKRTGWVLAVLTAAGGAYLARGSAVAESSPVERGRYLVNAIGCADCHSPKNLGPQGPSPDEQRFLAGHPEGSVLPQAPSLGNGPWLAVASWDLTAWSGPWGVSYAANLTPDENTGIGSWSEETFVKALRTGRHMGVSRPILPPMPWQFFRNLTDDDLEGDLRIPADDPAHPQPDPGAAPCARAVFNDAAR